MNHASVIVTSAAIGLAVIACTGDDPGPGSGNPASDAGTSGTSGTTGTSGGTSGTSGSAGTSGSSGTSGASGTSGTSGTSGAVDAGGRKLVFTTSETFTGNLGGLGGADASCTRLAKAAGHAGNYTAWLSAGTTQARDRIKPSATGWIRTDGLVVASSTTELLSGTLKVPLGVDETGKTIAGTPVPVFTNSDTSGRTQNSVGYDCVMFTSMSPPPSTQAYTYGGDATQTSMPWTTMATQIDCLGPARLYCFED